MMWTVATCCYNILALLAAGLIASGVAFSFQSTNYRRVVGILGSTQLRQHHDHRRRRGRSAPLFGRTPTDGSVIASNREYLMNELGFSEDAVDSIETRRSIKRQSGILTLESGVLEERANWLKTRLNLREVECQKMIRRSPNVLARRPEKNLAPKLDYLQKRLVLDETSLRKIILTSPDILNKSIEGNIAPKLDYLQKRLLLLDDETLLRKFVMGSPTIFNYSIEGKIAPKLCWLQRRLALDDDSLRKLVLGFPRCLECSIEDNIDPKLDWLQRRLGNLDDATAGKMITRRPMILGSSVSESLEPTLHWLQDRLSLTDNGLSRLVQKLPTLFGLSVKNNLEPTLNFYIDALGDEDEALDLVTQNPVFFACSLEKRLKPRLEEVRDAGMIVDRACLQRIGTYTDKRWYTSLDFQTRKLYRQ
mmetsp:Transcript_24159/g.58373  ORF Transcript_24159/g.58373 Transcript_24159/m.58373 type:complete len:420 (+) Transcript_24159:49-1308(+)